MDGAVEEPCALDDLAAATEAFLASSVREVQAVAAVDEREIALGGPVTAQAARRLRERIAASLGAKTAAG